MIVESKAEFDILSSENHSKISVLENNYSQGMIIENIPNKNSISSLTRAFSEKAKDDCFSESDRFSNVSHFSYL